VRWFWSRRWARIALLGGVCLLLACDKKSNNNPAGPGTPSALGLEPVASGMNFPLFLTSPPGDASRLFVVEKGGTIRIIQNGVVLATPFLDVSALVSGGPEQGLLCLVFDPAYSNTKRFYISYTDLGDSVKIARYHVSNSPNVAVATPDRVLLSVYKPEATHNGGMLEFGPDGMLYSGFGDGGGAGDPYNKGQDRSDLLGSMIRIDVSGAGYTVPASNPWAGSVAPELWNYGLRNPWRWSFDRATGDLYIGDVGQDSQEEVDVSTAMSGAGRGVDYGWSIAEGIACYPPGVDSCNRNGLTDPVIDYDHTVGCAVVGGYVYRGSASPGLRGTYFYGDFCNGWVRSFRYSGGTATEQTIWPDLNTGGNITSFGEDSRGEIYVMTQQGSVDRIVAR
jgi:glucose/arabinose dehydrogenase